MPQLALLIVGVGLALTVALAPLRISFAALVATIVLVPAPLTIPNGITSYLTIHNVVLVAAVLALVRERRRMEIPRADLHVTPVQTALFVLVAVATISGAALAGPSTVLTDLQHGLVDVVAQLVVLSLAIVYVRRLDHRFVILVLAATVVGAAGIAAAEHLTSESYGHFLFAGSSVRTEAAFRLSRRAGRLRVRGAAEFALEYAWMTVMLAPALVASLLFVPRRRWMWLGVPAAMTAATLYWSVSRSAMVAAPIAVLVVWIGTRWHRRITMAVAVLACLFVVLLSIRPAITAVLRPSTDQGSIDSRSERLPLVAEATGDRPLRGIGLGGLDQLGIPSTDASYNQVYAELGVLGLAAFALALLVAVIEIGRAFWAPRGPDRMLASVAFGGVLLGVLGSAAYDLFAVRGSSELFWLLAGIGVVAAERACGRRPTVRRLEGLRWVVPMGGAVAGLLVFLLTPQHAASTTRFVVTSGSMLGSVSSTFAADRALGQTACGAADDYATRAGAHVECHQLMTGRGVHEVRVEAPSAAKASRLQAEVVGAMTATVPSLRAFVLPGPVVGRPTAARTAPAWMLWLGLEAALLLPRTGLAVTVRRWSEEGWASGLR